MKNKNDFTFGNIFEIIDSAYQYMSIKDITEIANENSIGCIRRINNRPSSKQVKINDTPYVIELTTYKVITFYLIINNNLATVNFITKWDVLSSNIHDKDNITHNTDLYHTIEINYHDITYTKNIGIDDRICNIDWININDGIKIYENIVNFIDKIHKEIYEDLKEE